MTSLRFVRNARLPVAAVLATLVTPSFSPPPAHGADEADPWKPLHGLVGTWQGEGAGFGNVADLTHTWEFVIDGKFLRLRTRSVVRAEDGDGEVHEDVGYVSHDGDTGTFVFRQFLSEGFVNTYDVSFGDGGAITFDSRDVESGGGMRARMRFELQNDDAYTAALDLGGGEGELSTCQEMSLHRVR